MKNIEIYIHIPFCEKKCLYCDFVSFVGNNDIIHKYMLMLITEIENKSFIANDYTVSSIYIGGGTPSVIDKKYIGYILESLFKYYKISKDAEISIEVNPNSATLDKIDYYYKCGINRLSIGLQSANDEELKTLGRIHNYNDFINAYNNAIHSGFKNINVDLINGIPGETPESYKKSLKKVLSLGLKHISIYNLIIEDNTPFKTLLSENKITLPLEYDLLMMDKITKKLTNHYHLNRYEISNYAKEGFECKHNLGYWSDVPYLGFGLNSSSYIDRKRLKNKTNLKEYINLDYKNYVASNNQISYYDEIKDINETEHLNEFVMLSFRKTSGIDINEFYNKFNENFEEKYKSEIKYYQSRLLLCKKNNRYYLSDKGLDVSNKIIADFMK
ncbi:MAG: radical SAM family heme chaperone HemW [Lachnospiraceae bacterium]|nr:radical SAM family heme chaperone HemW [Lachnospiraceae bacterium]